MFVKKLLLPFMGFATLVGTFIQYSAGSPVSEILVWLVPSILVIGSAWFFVNRTEEKREGIQSRFE